MGIEKIMDQLKEVEGASGKNAADESLESEQLAQAAVNTGKEQQNVESGDTEVSAEEVAVGKEGESVDEENPGQEEKPTNDFFAKQRIKAREAEKEAEEARKEAQKLKAVLQALGVDPENPPGAKPKQSAEEDVEPDYDSDPDGWYKWDSRRKDAQLASITKEFEAYKQTQMAMNAKEELAAHEQGYSKAAPDYNDAKAYLIEKGIKKIQMLTPAISAVNARKQVEMELLSIAAQAASRGFDPAETLHYTAKIEGFEPKQKAEVAHSPTSKPLPMDALAKNKQKSASLLGAPNSGAMGKVTSSELVKMSFNDLLNVPDEDWNRMGISAQE